MAAIKIDVPAELLKDVEQFAPMYRPLVHSIIERAYLAGRVDALTAVVEANQRVAEIVKQMEG